MGYMMIHVTMGYMYDFTCLRVGYTHELAILLVNMMILGWWTTGMRVPWFLDKPIFWMMLPYLSVFESISERTASTQQIILVEENLESTGHVLIRWSSFGGWPDGEERHGGTTVGIQTTKSWESASSCRELGPYKWIQLVESAREYGPERMSNTTRKNE